MNNMNLLIINFLNILTQAWVFKDKLTGSTGFDVKVL